MVMKGDPVLSKEDGVLLMLRQGNSDVFYNAVRNPITQEMMFVESKATQSSDEILHDSGADRNFINDKQLHMVEDFVRESQDVRCGSGTVIDMVQGHGHIWFLGTRMVCSVAVKLAVSVISVGYCAREGIVSKFHEQGLTIDCRVGRIEYPLSNNNLYFLLPEWFSQYPNTVRSPIRQQPTVMIADASVEDKVALWHQRLGHSCNKRLIAMAKDEIYQQRGIHLTSSQIKAAAGKWCLVCAMAKSTVKKKVGTIIPYEPVVGECFYVDIAGPNPTPSIHGMRFSYVMVESVTGMVWVYCSASKDDQSTLLILEKFEVDQIGSVHPATETKYFVSDNGEMNSAQVRGYCRKAGYFNQFTPAYHSELNKAETRIKMMKSISKCLLAAALMPEPFWEYSDKYAGFLIRILPPCDGGDDKRDPYTQWFGKTYDYSKLRTWGCIAVAHISKQIKNRLPPGVRGIFVGVKNAEYQVYVPETNTLLSTADVTFHEVVNTIPSTVTEILEASAGRQHFDGIDPSSDQLLFRVEDFNGYVNTVHYDTQDKLYYVVTKIRVTKGSVVADRLACLPSELDVVDVVLAAHLLEYPLIEDKNKLDGLMLHSPPVRRFFARANAVGGKGGGFSGVASPNIQKLREPTPDTETSPSGKTAATETGMPPGPTQESCAERGSVKRPNLLRAESNGNDAATAGASAAEDRGRSMSGRNNSWLSDNQSSTPTSISGPSPRKVVKKALRIKPSWRYVSEEDIGDQDTLPPTDRDARMTKKENSRSATVLSTMFTLFMTIGMSALNIAIPSSHKKALQSPQSEEWKEAEQKEISSLWEVGAWAWEQLPIGRKPIRSKWTFDLKTNAEGIVQRFKARICARGDMTEEGIDYQETFSPVAKWESIRLFLAMTVLLHLIPMQLDVDLAYLYAPLTEAIYMLPPDGMEAPPGMVLRLLRSLYGLPQSGRNWYTHLDSNLTEAGFKRMEEDTCLYVRIVGGIITIVAVYVDDMYIAASNSETINALVEFLKTKYKMKILGVPQQLLGVKISWGRNFSTVSVSIPKMINNLVEKYSDQLSIRPTYIPINPGHNLSKQDCPSLDGLSKGERDGITFMQSCYRNLVGSFIWICHTCRPDIMYVTMILCMYMQNPGRKHWEVALQALDYLKLNSKKGICYRSDGNTIPFGYADSDFSAHETRRSVGSFIFMLAGGPFSWKSVLGKIIALSTCEAEIRAIHAAYHAIKESIWLAKLFKELGVIDTGNEDYLPIRIHEDNLAAIMFTKNPVYHSTMKHLERALYWIRASVDQRLVVLTPTKTEDQWADIGTKPFFRPRFEFLTEKFMVECE